MRERKSSWAWPFAVGLLVVGCSGRRAAISAGEPGTTTILIENSLASPDELDRLLVTVDDATVPLATVPPRGEGPVPFTALRLPPGPHLLSVRATTHGAGDDRVVVAAAQTFHVAAAAASIGIAIRSRAASPSEERIAVDLQIHGGRLATPLGAGPTARAAERCAPLQPIAHALCRAATDMDEAARLRDLVGVLCVRDRLTAMQQLAAIGVTAEPRVLALAREIDRCGGHDLVGRPDGTTVRKSGAPL